MSTKEIQKNFDLAMEFDNYVIKNPNVFIDIDGSPCVVMGEVGDKSFTEKNRTLAKKIARKEGKKCYQAMYDKKNKKNKWTVEPITV